VAYVRREPLVHFACGGGLIFLVYCLSAGPESEAIVVTPDMSQAIARQRSESLGRPLSAGERSAAVAEFIDDEVLVREARRRGIDHNDAVLRERLADKMRFLLGSEPSEPAREQLAAYLAENRDRFLTPPQVSFDQVFFECRPDAPPRNDAGLLAALGRGADFRKLGDRSRLGAAVGRVEEAQLAVSLGADFAQAVFALEPGRWSGPLRSERGIHFVRVTEKRRTALPPFEDLLPVLKRQWVTAQRDAALRENLAELRKQYRIEVASGGPP
jgi:hypothetical protein